MISAVSFKNHQSMDGGEDQYFNESNTGSSTRRRNVDNDDDSVCMRGTKRTIFYYLALGLVFVATIFIMVALFTNNWVKTAKYLVSNVYYTYGLWFYCKRFIYNTNPMNYATNQGYQDFQGYDIYSNAICITIDYSSASYIIACQVFYVIAAVINLAALAVAYLGICVDFRSRLFVPSILLWSLLVSSVAQLIAISVYGGQGAGNYSWLVPDYSMILASFALVINFFSAVFFAIECIYFKHKYSDPY